MRTDNKYTLMLNGLTLSTLFFYPLCSALMPNSSQWLLWTNQDRLETISAWLILAIAISGTLHLLDRFFSRRINVIFALLALLFGIFFGIAPFLRNELIVSTLEKHPHYLYSTLLILVLSIILFYISLKFDIVRLAAIRKFLQILSPISVIFLAVIITANISPNSNEILDHNISYETSKTQSKNQNKLTVILLFDELSVDYLYGSKKIDLTPYPSINKLIETSSKFTNAHLPGGKTDVAVTDLMRRKLGEVNLETLLQNEGRQSKVMGWYIDYCNRFHLQYTDCNTISNYNVRTLDEKVSILHPFLTNFNVLPYKNPYGYIKIPIATDTHRRTFSKISSWILRQLDDPGSKIIYAHLNLPHAPAIDENIAVENNQKIFDTTEYSYLSQLKYIDIELAKIQEKIIQISNNREVNLVVLSDHNTRALSKQSTHSNIALLYLPSNKVTTTKKQLDKNIHPSELLIPLINKN